MRRRSAARYSRSLMMWGHASASTQMCMARLRRQTPPGRQKAALSDVFVASLMTAPCPAPPRPLIDADGLQGLHRGHRGRPHQAEQGGKTGGEPQARGESGTSVPAESHADGPEGRDQLPGFSRIRRDQGRETLGENMARTVRVPAEKLPDRELETHGLRPPWEIGEV